MKKWRGLLGVLVISLVWGLLLDFTIYTTHAEGNPDPQKSTNKNISARGCANQHPVYYSFNLPKNQRKVVITFDDGPDGIYTPKVLDILQRYNVKATFFVMGKSAVNHPEQLKRIVRDGHTVGNHTWHHSDFQLISEKEIENDLLKNEKYIQEELGIKPLFVRPPFGRINEKICRVASRYHYTLVHWDVDPKDWDGRSADRILNWVKEKVKPGSIILLHSGGGEPYLDGSIKALPQIIEYLRKEKYQIVPLQELLKIPPYEKVRKK
ncbi:polysaccharide deacetylase family protein [Thermoactinomyces sp. DSM 45892]|uniref:polysaccharide deacetylase family protein n=1 Tax=Thermoactinomyces sp. DSM 45892 TaxID=1882753 RepID=UPI00089A80A6|nr:polysaccharide deacetylase family protein [Thermoactinomyces sp. DSM 45892]SDY03729.1 Peptidoglycan/xylan/chitin deacetylase, PgdA/CDA1 family [Thermoactinomyces sp. DSM 45892]